MSEPVTLVAKQTVVDDPASTQSTSVRSGWPLSRQALVNGHGRPIVLSEAAQNAARDFFREGIFDIYILGLFCF